jgi:hypothetical protein
MWYTIIKTLYSSKTHVLEDYILVINDAASLGDQLMTLFAKMKWSKNNYCIDLLSESKQLKGRLYKSCMEFHA